MPSNLNAHALSAVMLAALLLRAHGAPAGDALTDSPTEYSSGEEVATTETTGPTKPSVLSSLYNVLEITTCLQIDLKTLTSDYNSNLSFPRKCPATHLSKEARLRWLLEGLQTYTVLLRHVDREYPNNGTVSNIKYFTNRLITLTNEEMKNPQRVKALTSSQEKQLLKNLNNKDNFQRKREAQQILKMFHFFVLDCMRSIRSKQSQNSPISEPEGCQIKNSV